MKDKIIESIREDLLRRSEIGIKKYGTTLDREDYKLKDWITSMYEELLDATGYLKALEKKLSERTTIKFMSDTHGFHSQEPLDPVDILIHSGDATNYYDVTKNKVEWDDFWEWFCNYPARYRVYIPGNHDTYVERNLNTINCPENTYILVHQEVNIMGFNVFGSPYTPTFGNWAYMKDRGTINRIWEVMPDNIDILVTHGPPRYILDNVAINNNESEHVGDNSLRKEVIKRKPLIHSFGHIHDNENCLNHGIFERDGTRYINASQVKDGKFEKGLINKSIIVTL